MLALIVASFLGQIHIDPSYTPRPGDRAVLGAPICLRGRREPDLIQRAECYATLDGVRGSIAAGSDELAEDGVRVATLHDAYFPRAGTRVEVVADVPVPYTAGGVNPGARAIQVKVLEGELRGRLLYVRRSSVIRLTGRPGPRR